MKKETFWAVAFGLACLLFFSTAIYSAYIDYIDHLSQKENPISDPHNTHEFIFIMAIALAFICGNECLNIIKKSKKFKNL